MESENSAGFYDSLPDIVRRTMRKVLALFFCIGVGVLTPAVLLTQGPPAVAPAVVRMTVQTTDGKTLTGRVDRKSVV